MVTLDGFVEGEPGLTLEETRWLCELAEDCRLIVEIGSDIGVTARMLAQNTPEDAVVYTVDVWGAYPLGAAYLRSPVAHKIVQCVRHRDQLVLPGFRGVDLVFVDGAHEEPWVTADSTQARQMVRRGGTVVWHNARWFDEGDVWAYLEGEFEPDRMVWGPHSIVRVDF